MLLAALLAAATPACAMAAADRAWLDDALAHWRVAERSILKLPPTPLPVVYAIDARCTYVGRPDRSGLRWTGRPHGRTIALPGNKTLPLGPISFAAPDAGGYFAMSLPSVWRAAKVTSELGLERLMDGVMLHELMHTLQFYFANPSLAALTKQYALGDNIGDDSLQDRFKHTPGYVAEYQRERDLLFAAAAAPTDVEARRLAREALAAMRARRAKWFIGADAKWLPLDDLFLTMEGLGQWLAYAWYVSPSGARSPPATVLPLVRRGGKYWTQDEGLALFLTIDRLVPGWQRAAFADRPLLAEALLSRAAARP